jgi:hypothetical protein
LALFKTGPGGLSLWQVNKKNKKQKKKFNVTGGLIQEGKPPFLLNHYSIKVAV